MLLTGKTAYPSWSRAFLFCYGVLPLAVATISAIEMPQAAAQQSDFSYEEAAKTKLIREPGKPIRLDFADGRQAVFISEKESRVFKSKLRMVENNCVKAPALTCQISFPYPVVRTALKWTKHPTREGQFVQKRDYPDEKKLVTEMIGRPNFALFSGDGVVNQQAGRSTYGEITCPNTDWIPWTEGQKGRRTGMIEFWDEDFELTNSEIAYHVQAEGESFNSFSGRFEGLPLFESGRKILLGKPDAGQLMFGGGFFNFPMVAYKLQLTFNEPAKDGTGDPQCQVKMTTEFGKIFTEVVRIFNFAQDEAQPKIENFKPLIDGAFNPNQIYDYWLTEQQWHRELL